LKVYKNLKNPCDLKKDRCMNCHSHFLTIRPFIREAVVSKHFIKDLKDEEEAELIVNDILDCSNTDFTELHKYEGSSDGNLIFRAKKEGVHIVYCVDKQRRIIFLRAFRNYSEYGKFLEDKKEIKRLLAHVELMEDWDLKKQNKTESDASSEEQKEEEEEDEVLEKEEKKTKARLRTRGPYRKAHADW
jgi:mRNA-degrading endonuclease RelE of RelBE toxin-antitoxin system